MSRSLVVILKALSAYFLLTLSHLLLDVRLAFACMILPTARTLDQLLLDGVCACNSLLIGDYLTFFECLAYAVQIAFPI